MIAHAMAGVVALSLLGSAIGANRVGEWTKAIGGLPNGKLASAPVLGNGYAGVVLGTSGGENDFDNLDFWINTNAVWDCQPSQTALPPAKCGRKAFAGVTISLPSGLAVEFVAQQMLMPGKLKTVHSTKSNGTFSTVTAIAPEENIILCNMTWSPGQGDPSDLALNLSSWVFSGNMSTSANKVLVGSRKLGSSNMTVRAVWTAIATSVPNNVVTAASQSQVAPNGASAASIALSLPAGSKSVPIVMAVSDNLLHNNEYDPSVDAIAKLQQVNIGQVSQDVDIFWASFWNKSSIRLPGFPIVEDFWYGSQYISAAMSASGSVLTKNKNLIPPSGLYGPWVTSDNPSWHGDFTLDYNQEAQYYGFYSSNHGEHAEPYFQPILDWVTAGKVNAQEHCVTENITCPSTAIHFACHLAPWGYQSEDQTTYMHWNANFASLLFINKWEYTQDNEWASSVAYPLLDGINSWWTSYLVKDSTGFYLDFRSSDPDNEHEGQKVANPQIGLALVYRTMTAQRDIAKALGITPPENVLDVINNFPAWNLGEKPLNAHEKVWTAYANASVEQSDAFAIYPIWPSEVVGIDASPSMLSTAQLSFDQYYGKGIGTRPVLVYPASTRMGPSSSSVAINNLQTWLQKNQQPSYMPTAPGGGTENIGVASAVNDMLVQSPNSRYIHLFPVWPSGEEASFSNLLVKGGFLVSAALDTAGAVSGFGIRSLKSQQCSFKSPWSGANENTVKVICKGNSLQVNLVGDIFSYKAPQNILCMVQHHA